MTEPAQSKIGFIAEKVTLPFKEVVIGQSVYMKRFSDGCASDSIHMTKECDRYANSPEWGKSEIHPDQLCWFFQ